MHKSLSCPMMLQTENCHYTWKMIFFFLLQIESIVWKIKNKNLIVLICTFIKLLSDPTK